MAITTDEAFKAHVASPLALVHFTAEWAEECTQMDAVIAELSKIHSAVKFANAEAEELPDIAQQYSVEAVPTLVLFQAGEVLGRVDGFEPFALTKLLESHKGKTAAVTPAAPVPKTDITKRLTELVNAAPVMLFMKGTPDEPQCGFSRKIVAALKAQDAKFSTFNILADAEVRAELKTFSDWPTYPQLYIGGDLIGGLDIVNEMIESGQFADALPKEESLNDRLTKLINRQDVMVFIKGTPDAPRCGFSRTIVGILNEIEGLDYGYYDILGDEQVRAGLKVFSDWPTFPQLYKAGELLGGLDIIKEMDANGELGSSLL